jgi:hypothetical protein
MNDIAGQRRKQLQETIKKAAKELLGFGGMPLAGFSFPLDDTQTTWIIVRPATEEEADAELAKR